MTTTQDQRQLLTLCAIPKLNWNLLAREAQRPDGLARVLRAELSENAEQSRVAASMIRDGCAEPSDLEERVRRELEGLPEDVRLTTVLDDDYPSNLRVIFNLPPFLFYRGTLRPEDARSVAVVGTRNASEEGRALAAEIATELAKRGVSVLSGLAKGIDAAAHIATLDAGGRTIAVFGTGITQVYPKENTELARRIVASGGAVVSQFWPSAGPMRQNFPMRNVVTSGMSQGTVVVEASGNSGARNQARRALEHGKRVFLLPLVTGEEWARRSLERGAIEVDRADEIVDLLRSPEEIEQQSERRRQLVLDLA